MPLWLQLVVRAHNKLEDPLRSATSPKVTILYQSIDGSKLWIHVSICGMLLSLFLFFCTLYLDPIRAPPLHLIKKYNNVWPRKRIISSCTTDILIFLVESLILNFFDEPYMSMESFMIKGVPNMHSVTSNARTFSALSENEKTSQYSRVTYPTIY